MSSLCTICSECAAKYKCPKCRAGYCSVKCFKIHKTEPCMPQIQQAGGSSSSSSSSSQSGANASQQRQRQQQQQRDPEKVEIKGAKNSQMPDGGSENNVGDEDDEEEQKYRLKPEDLQKLERSARVKGLLMNPNIRALMNQVRKDASPAEAVRVLRQRSAEFEELVQAFIQATE